VETAPVTRDFAETLRAARTGEPHSVAALWTDLYPRLLTYLMARDRQSAEDLASETWIKVSRGLPRFEGSEIEFRAWAFTVARHTLIDWHRQRKRRPDLVTDPGNLVVVDDPDVENCAIETLQTEAALRLVRQLPRDQADAVLLRVVAGLDATQVGRIMGRRPGAVRVLQHRGLRRLAALLRADAPTDRGVTR
jgi:RNA polymerase sigma-70 factor, ECF subfamily